MKDFKQKADNAVFVASAIGPWGILMVIVGIVGLVKCCVMKPPDLAEESINKSGNIVEHVMVLDSTNNGFRVVYATGEAVTNEKYEEIRGRPHIQTRFNRLKVEAPKYFGGSLLNTDICDFALYAYRFPIDNDLRIHNIFVAGKEKMNLYVQPNPNLPNCATWMNFGTEQGNQYLNFHDINVYIPNGGRIYRYWKCRPLLQVSDNDEHFSHFTEDERLF